MSHLQGHALHPPWAHDKWGPLENPQSHPRPAKALAALAAAAEAALGSPRADVAPARRAAHLAPQGEIGDAYVEYPEWKIYINM